MVWSCFTCLRRECPPHNPTVNGVLCLSLRTAAWSSPEDAVGNGELKGGLGRGHLGKIVSTAMQEAVRKQAAAGRMKHGQSVSVKVPDVIMLLGKAIRRSWTFENNIKVRCGVGCFLIRIVCQRLSFSCDSCGTGMEDNGKATLGLETSLPEPLLPVVEPRQGAAGHGRWAGDTSSQHAARHSAEVRLEGRGESLPRRVEGDGRRVAEGDPEHSEAAVQTRHPSTPWRCLGPATSLSSNMRPLLTAWWRCFLGEG